VLLLDLGVLADADDDDDDDDKAVLPLLLFLDAESEGAEVPPLVAIDIIAPPPP